MYNTKKEERKIMRKSFKAVICLLVLVMFTGVGFSAWFFGANLGQSGSVKGGISVAPLLNIGDNLVIKDGATTIYDTKLHTTTQEVTALDITLDQGDADEDSSLIYFGGNTSVVTKTLTFVYTISADIDENASAAEIEEAVDLVNGKVVSFAVTAELTPLLDGYISAVLTPGATDANVAATAESLTRTVTHTVTLSFVYDAEQKPQNATDYATMVGKLATGQSYTINAAVTVA